MVIRNNNIAPGGDIHTYGFDTYKENLPPDTYNSITVGDQILHLPWKSVAVGGSDRLFATPVGDTTITFAYQSGMPVNASSNQERYTLWTGSPPAGEDNLLALCSIDSTDNAAVAGGVRVKSYELTRHNVVVVPIGNNQPTFTEQELRNALNDIYAQAVIDWDVSILSPLDGNYFEWLSGGVEVNTTDYSEDMREVWRTFVMLQNATPGTTYLFIIPGFKDHPGMTGYMPLKSGYGFLTPSATTRDAAHELAHGVFNLRHTFSQHNTFTLPEGNTQNLMDYGGGTELWKYQWDFIHDPEGGWFIFEDSEEGATWFNSKLARIELNSEILNTEGSNYIIPGIDDSFEFSAYEFKNDEYTPLKVDWLFNGTEINNQENASFNVSDDDFINIESITLTIKEKVTLGSDSILNVNFIPLNINIELIITEELSHIAQAYNEFYSNRESLLDYIQENSIMRVLFTGQNDEYINHKMSDYFKEPSEAPAEEFDLYLFNMYNNDLVLAPLEENFVLEVLQIMSEDDSGVYYLSDESLIADLKPRIEKSEENLSKEELEAFYNNQIKNLIFEIINERADEN